MDTKRLLKKAVPYIELARPLNATAALLSFIVGYVFYSPKGWVNLYIGLFIVALLHSSTTIQNDIYDLDVDASNKRSSGLLSKEISVAGTKQVVLFLVMTSLVIATLSQQKIACLLFICAFAVVSWVYNAKPFMLSRRPFGSIVLLGIFYSFLPVYFGLVLAGHRITTLFIGFAIFYALARCSVSILKDYKDIIGDTKHHKRTFLVAYGHSAVAWVSIGLSFITYPTIGWLLLHDRPRSLLVAFTFVLLGLIIVLQILNRLQLLKSCDNKHLNEIFKKSFAGENYFSVMLILCLSIR